MKAWWWWKPSETQTSHCRRHRSSHQLNQPTLSRTHFQKLTFWVQTKKWLNGCLCERVNSKIPSWQRRRRGRSSGAMTFSGWRGACRTFGLQRRGWIWWGRLCSYGGQNGHGGEKGWHCWRGRSQGGGGKTELWGRPLKGALREWLRSSFLFNSWVYL